MSKLVYRPYHVITKVSNSILCKLHVVDSFGAIVHRFALPTFESIEFYDLTDYRFAIFFATPGRLERWLHIYESTTFQLLKSIPFATRILSLIQLRHTKQIIILTRAQGFHIYSNNLEFEQQVNHEGVLIECLCELEEEDYTEASVVVTATSDYQLHFWCSKKWTKLNSIKIPPTFDDDFMNGFNQLHRVVNWREKGTLIVITENSFTFNEQNQWRICRCIDPNKDNYPILLKDTFLFRYGYHHDVRLFTIPNENLTDILFMKHLPTYISGASLQDGRVLFQTKNELIEYNVNDQEFTKIRTRHHLNDFRFVHALQTKQDDDLLVSWLDYYVELWIPIMDLRQIVYEFI